MTTHRRLAVLLLVVLAAATPVAGIGWATKAPMPTGRVSLVAATGADGTIYAITGYPETFGQPQLNTANEAYDPVANMWTSRAPIPTARSLPGGAAAHDGTIYVIGGATNGPVLYSGVVEAYSPATDTWSGPLAPMPTGRYELALVDAGTGAQERLYAMGGFNNGGPSLSTVEAYNPATNSWTTVAPLPTPRRGLAAVAGPDGLVYAIGGSPQSGLPPVATVDAYDPATNTWSARAPMNTARAYHAAAVGGDGLIYVMGGNFSIASVEAYDPATDKWTAVASLPSARSALAAASSLDGRVFAIGGYGGDQEVDALVLSGATATPSALSFAPQGVGTSSAAQSVTLLSDGTLPLLVGAAGVSGSNAGDFAIVSDSCSGQSFAPGSSCTIAVAFTPTAAGGRGATLVIPDNSARRSQTISLSGAGVILDATPPVLNLPADFAVNADSPGGAIVTYVVTASDPDDAVSSISCNPPSGSLFPIGSTAVTCTATDTHQNTSAPGTFHVVVKAADAQLADLIAAVNGVGPGKSLAAKLQTALAALTSGNTAGVCSALDDFLNEVAAQAGKSLSQAQAADLSAAAMRIKSVVGCP